MRSLSALQCSAAPSMICIELHNAVKPPYLCFARQASIHARASAACGDFPGGVAPLLELDPNAGAPLDTGSAPCCLAANPTAASAATPATPRPTRLGLAAGAAVAVDATGAGACTDRAHIHHRAELLYVSGILST